MPRNKEPIDLILKKGNSHKTKAEIEERRATELRPLTESIEPPAFLKTKRQKNAFNALAQQLLEWDIMSATDCIALGRYVVAVEQYEACVKKLKSKEAQAELKIYDAWSDRLDKYDKMCGRLEAKLGLTPVDRAKLSAPAKAEETKVNRFAQFSVSGKAAGDG